METDDKKESEISKPKDGAALALPTGQTDFSRFFTSKYEAERIVGATDEYGELHFLIKWKNKKEADLIPSKIANVKIPQVHDFDKKIALKISRNIDI